MSALKGYAQGGTVPAPAPRLPDSLLRDLRTVVGPDGLVTEPGRLLVYESDALTRFRETPAAVVLPRSTEQTAALVRLLVGAGIPITPRGAGTGLSGGGVVAPGGVLVGTSRMNRILSLDPARRLARVQAGVINNDLSAAAAPHGLHYAPDPASQPACTLGGNVGENAGGPHCLKYGVTTRYVTGLTLVAGTGEVLELGGAHRCEGIDLTGIFVGSEGRLGLATEIEVRLVPTPRAARTFLAVFRSTEAAGSAVSAIIADGLLPAAMEIMDRRTIQAVESSMYRSGYPTDAGAVLVVEFDGTEAGLDAESHRAQALSLEAGATEIRRARSESERQALWQGRKKAYGAFGRITPDLMVQDATVPRSALPEVLNRIDEVGRKYDLVLANVFHAGDGNLHPKILFDRRDRELVERVELASKEIMQICVDAGGTITGEHGVGLDKRDYMPLVHSPAELEAMRAVQRVFDPAGVWNPGKVLPEREGAAAGEPGESTDAGVGTAPRAGAVTTDLVHHPADLTVTVGAGCSFAALEEELAREGQWLPVDPPGIGAMTVGDLVERGAWGPLAPSVGRVRDLVLGATLVTPDGRRLSMGGRVMKNVAGFDLVRGLVGSRGRWGTVTSATFRLLPIPEAHAVLTWEGSAAEMRALARALSVHPILPASLVRVAGGGFDRVFLRLLGSRATVDAERDELAGTFPGGVFWDEMPTGAGFLRGDPMATAMRGGEGVDGDTLELRPGPTDWETLDRWLAELTETSEIHHLPLWDVWRIPGAKGEIPALTARVRTGGGDAAWMAAGPESSGELERKVCGVFHPGVSEEAG